MIFVTYNAQTGALISVTDAPPPGDPTTCTRVLNAQAADLSTWDTQQRAFRDELGDTQTTRITKLAFDNRFTPLELRRIDLLAIHNPASPVAIQELAADLRVNQRKVDRAQHIDLALAQNRLGVQQLEAVGILAAGRALVILDAPAQPHEIYVEPK